jgi:hypothetical protein
MRRVRVPEGIIGHLEKTWIAQQTLGVFEEAATSWRKQLQEELLSQRIGWLRGGNHFRGRSSERDAEF